MLIWNHYHMISPPPNPPIPHHFTRLTLLYCMFKSHNFYKKKVSFTDRFIYLRVFVFHGVWYIVGLYKAIYLCIRILAVIAHPVNFWNPCNDTHMTSESKTLAWPESSQTDTFRLVFIARLIPSVHIGDQSWILVMAMKFLLLLLLIFMFCNILPINAFY